MALWQRSKFLYFVQIVIFSDIVSINLVTGKRILLLILDSFMKIHKITSEAQCFALIVLFVNRHMHTTVNGISVMWISIAAVISSVAAMSTVCGTSGKHVFSYGYI
jgi:hypothetical protein